jgi:phosphoribosylanthranilate isomerase
MWVKICANTNLKDAAMAADLGADAVGFVFAPSKRQVTAAQVATITTHLPESVERVGVFATGDVQEIARTVADAGLTAVQLHGAFDLDFAARLTARLGPEISLIQTVHWTVGNVGNASQTADDVARQLADLASASPASRVLVDSKIGTASGGTGVSFDWSDARAVFAGQPQLRIVVAGGLTPDNVAQAVHQLNPWGVDVASGVESSPGRKDPTRLANFIANARRAYG